MFWRKDSDKSDPNEDKKNSSDPNNDQESKEIVWLTRMCAHRLCR